MASSHSSNKNNAQFEVIRLFFGNKVENTLGVLVQAIGCHRVGTLYQAGDNCHDLSDEMILGISL